MAQVTQSSQLGARIEHFLTYALREWSAVPKYAAEFDAWDPIQQVVFVHEWGIRESALAVLHDYAAQGLLSPAQRAQYEQLLQLVAKHRPVLEQLLED